MLRVDGFRAGAGAWPISSYYEYCTAVSLKLDHDHLPSPVGLRPEETTLCDSSSVMTIPVPLYCLGREMSSSVRLFAMQARNVRKMGSHSFIPLILRWEQLPAKAEF